MHEWETATKTLREELDTLTASLYEGKRKGAVKQFPEDIQAIYWKKREDRTAEEEQLTQLVQRQVDFEYRRLNFAKSFEKDPPKLAKYLELTTALKALDLFLSTPEQARDLAASMVAAARALDEWADTVDPDPITAATERLIRTHEQGVS